MTRIDPPINGLRHALFGATIAAFLLAVAGSFVNGSTGTTLAALAVCVIVAVPLLRVAVVGVRWWRDGDWRFAAAAAALLLIVGTGAIIAVL